MADLTDDEVRKLAACNGIALEGDDLTDVTLRLNATLEHLANLDVVELDEAAVLNVKEL